ncbi:hypothetical protein ABB02_00482 [Clostridiaceae bacterium JG1575]|nr:hypothetical protein ABB02_00482 [Clostridiaceae bacterium JG1575]
MLLLLLVCLLLPQTIAQAAIPSAPIVNAKSVVVMDAHSGQILYSKRPEDPLTTQSLLPMLTAMTVTKTHSLQEFLLVDESAGQGRTKIKGPQGGAGLKSGERLKISQILSALLLAQSPDALRALSSLYPSETAFLEALQGTINSLNLSQTKITELFPEKNSPDRTTASDMAKVMQAFTQWPDLLTLANQSSYTFVPNNMVPEPRVIQNTNLQVVPRSEAAYQKARAGFFSENLFEDPGNNLFIALASAKDSEFIVALGHSSNGKEAFSNSKALFDWAFNNYRSEKLIRKGEILSELPLPSKEVLTLESGEDFYFLDNAKEGEKTNFSLSFKPKEWTGKSITRHQNMGSADILVRDKVVGSVPLLASKDLTLPQENTASTEPTRPSLPLVLLFFFGVLILLVLLIRTYNLYRRSLRKGRTLKRQRQRLDLSKKTPEDDDWPKFPRG